MKTVSAAWADAILAGRARLTRVSVIDGETGAITPIPVSDGDVTLDAGAEIQGAARVTVPGEGYVPTTDTDLLAPIDNEIQVERGVEYVDGSTEYVSLGIFGIQSADLDDDGGDFATEVEALDRSKRISNAMLEDTYQIARGTQMGAAIVALAQNAWPAVPYHSASFAAVTETLPKIVANAGDDRWSIMVDIATALGRVLFFDGDGYMDIKPYAPSGIATTVREGDRGLLLSAARNWSKEDRFNRVIATGENSDNSAVYRGVATDETPTSPTRYTGPFGKAPRFYSSPYIASTNQAQDAADAILAQELGTVANLSFGMIPDPALEPGDKVLVQRERMGLNVEHVIDSVRIGLGTDQEMDCVTREVIV